MTVVVAVKCDDGRIVMGGDSFCGTEDLSDLCAEPKVYTTGPIGVCACGTIRAEQVLSQTIVDMVDKRQKKEKLITARWLKFTLLDRIRENLKACGTLSDQSGVQQIPESHFLLCFNGVIYHLQTDLSLWESQRPFAAAGAGSSLACGALSYALLGIEGLPSYEEAAIIVCNTLNVCAEWSPWVSPPNVLVTVPVA